MLLSFCWKKKKAGGEAASGVGQSGEVAQDTGSREAHSTVVVLILTR
jgi:hypothetical protein